MKLTKLKVRPQKVIESSPCIVELGALFECWAISGVDDKACLNAANSLKNCMTKVKAKPKHKSTINYHLARLSKQL